MEIDFFGFAYAASVTAGGMLGYAKAQSLPSLVAGLVFGCLLTYGALQITRNPNNIFLSLGTSMFLAALMCYRFVVTGKMMPSGMIAMISLGNIVRLSYRLAVPIKDD